MPVSEETGAVINDDTDSSASREVSDEEYGVGNSAQESSSNNIDIDNDDSATEEMMTPTVQSSLETVDDQANAQDSSLADVSRDESTMDEYPLPHSRDATIDDLADSKANVTGGPEVLDDDNTESPQPLTKQIRRAGYSADTNDSGRHKHIYFTGIEQINLSGDPSINPAINNFSRDLEKIRWIEYILDSGKTMSQDRVSSYGIQCKQHNFSERSARVPLAINKFGGADAIKKKLAMHSGSMGDLHDVDLGIAAVDGFSSRFGGIMSRNSSRDDIDDVFSIVTDGEAVDNESNTTTHRRHSLGQLIAHGESTLLIPNAWKVPSETNADNEMLPLVYSEPVPKWYKERRTRGVIGLLCCFAVGTAIALRASFSMNRTVTEVQTVMQTVAPTSSPSVSVIPSVSQVPSSSPTSCGFTVAESAKSIELPLNDAVRPFMVVEGENLAISAMEANTLRIHLVLYEQLDGITWERVRVFQKDYPELNVDVHYDWSIALQGPNLFLGFPKKNAVAGNNSGIVYVFEQPTDGDWQEKDPLVPMNATAEAFFGHMSTIDDTLAVVGAHNEQSLYVFEKNNGNGTWEQVTKHYIGYDLTHIFLKGSTILTFDSIWQDIHLYNYDQALNQIVEIQDPVVLNSSIREYGGWMELAEATNYTTLIMDIEFDGDFFVYSKQTFGVNEEEWFMQDDVYVYKRLEGKHTFALHQSLPYNDYDEMFGQKISLSGDLLHIKSANNSYIFSLHSGYFRESFVMDKNFDTFRISGRNAIAAVNGNEYYSLDLSDCTQQMPTPHPSLSAAPSNIPSASLYPSTIPPTSSQPPSLAPLISFEPSISYLPSINSAPHLLLQRRYRNHNQKQRRMLWYR